jgi:hypothetical protein
MSTRRLSRDSNIAPELIEPGTRVIHPRYQEGQRVRYRNVGGKPALTLPTLEVFILRTDPV